MKIKNIFELTSKTFGLSEESNRFYLVIIALLIFFAYLPSLQYDYVTGDQWRAFHYSMLDESPLVKAHKCFSEQIPFTLSIGRPLGSIGECVEHSLVGKISDFAKARPMVLILVVLTAFCVGMALSSSVGGILNGAAIGALFVLSPGYAFVYHNGLESVMKLIALILATLSYIFARQAINDVFHQNKLLLSSALFLVACMIYPPWAFIVFMFSLIDFLFCKNIELNTRLKHLLIKILLFTAISIIYYLIIKLIIIFLPANNFGNYEYSANFNPIYLGKRFILASFIFIAQPPLNTLYGSLRILNIIFLFLVIAICTGSFFKKKDGKFINAFFKYLLIIILCVSLIFASIIPWLVSAMPAPPNRVLIAFFLLICTLIGWVISRVPTQLFPTKKYIATILLVFIVLLPASAIQNKRTAIEVGISGTEIEAMRLVVHKWINEYSFTKKRYIVVVKPKRPRPLFYDGVLNSVRYGDTLIFSNDHLLSKILPELIKGNDNQLVLYKLFSELIKERSDRHHIAVSLVQILNLAAGYGESLGFSPNPTYYFTMFTALIREECDRHHPFGLMKTYNLASTQEGAEEILDDSPRNIVFTVVNQGEQVRTKHDILEINFSLITNLPEPLNRNN
ncbi:MAG: hypothetical protein WC373_03570 [Smithella sp.]|jgi:hypothetical protein